MIQKLLKNLYEGLSFFVINLWKKIKNIYETLNVYFLKRSEDIESFFFILVLFFIHLCLFCVFLEFVFDYNLCDNFYYYLKDILTSPELTKETVTPIEGEGVDVRATNHGVISDIPEATLAEMDEDLKNAMRESMLEVYHRLNLESGLHAFTDELAKVLDYQLTAEQKQYLAYLKEHEPEKLGKILKNSYKCF